MQASRFALLSLLTSSLAAHAGVYRQPQIFEVQPSDITLDEQNQKLVIILHGRFPQGFEKPEFYVSCGGHDVEGVEGADTATAASEGRGATLTFTMPIPPSTASDCTVQVKDNSQDAKLEVTASKSLPRPFKLDASKLPAASAPSSANGGQTSAAPTQSYAPAPTYTSTTSSSAPSSDENDSDVGAGATEVEAQLILAAVTRKTPPVCTEVSYYDDSWGSSSFSRTFDSDKKQESRAHKELKCTGGGYENFVTDLKQSDFEVFATPLHGGASQRLTDQFMFKFQMLPTTVGILLDSSGSMIHFNKRAHAAEAAHRLIDAISAVHDDKRDSNAFVMNFNGSFFFNDLEMEKPSTYYALRRASRGDFDLPATQAARAQLEKEAVARLTDNPKDLGIWVDLANQSGDTHSIPLAGSTKMRDAIDRAIDQIRWGRAYDTDNPSPELAAHTAKIIELLNKYRADFIAEGKNPSEAEELAGQKAMPSKDEIITIDAIHAATDKVRPRAVLFVISDGVDTDSSIDFATLVANVRRRNIQVFGINFGESGPDSSQNELVRLAKISGGEAISIPETASDSEVASEAGAFTNRVIRMLQNQYSLAFRDRINGCRNLKVVARDFAAGQPDWLRSRYADYDRERRAFDLAHLPKYDDSSRADSASEYYNSGSGSSGAVIIRVTPGSSTTVNTHGSDGAERTQSASSAPPTSRDLPPWLPGRVAKAAAQCFDNGNGDTYVAVPKFGRMCGNAAKINQALESFLAEGDSGERSDRLDRINQAGLSYAVFRDGTAQEEPVELLGFRLRAYARSSERAKSASAGIGPQCKDGCQAYGQSCVCGAATIQDLTPIPEFMSFSEWLAKQPENYDGYVARMKREKGQPWIDSHPALTVYARQFVGDCSVREVKSALDDPGLGSNNNGNGSGKKGKSSNGNF